MTVEKILAEAEAKRVEAKTKARRKLLALCSRSELEQLSGMTSPWHADLPTLKEAAIANWDADEVQAILTRLMEKAA